MKDNEKLALLRNLNEAHTLGQTEDSISRFNSHYKLAFDKLVSIKKTVIVALLSIAVLLGASIAPSTFGQSDGNHINVFWLLLLLLGANTLSLLLWLLSCFIRPSGSRNWQHIVQLLIRFGAKLAKSEPRYVKAYQELYLANQRGKWLIGSLMHTTWACYLMGGLLSTGVYLMTHEVHFVWETTLLSSSDFQNFTRLLGAFPNLLGVSVPSNLEVQLSALSNTEWSNAGWSNAELSNTERLPALQQKWAYLVLFSIILYGIVPRFLLITFSYSRYKFTLSQAIKAILAHAKASQKEQHQTIIIDEDSKGADITTSTATKIKSATASDFNAPLFGFEWDGDKVNGHSLKTINNRQDQKELLEHNVPLSAFSLVVNGGNCPDRGSLRFLKQMAQASTHFTLIIVGNTYEQQWVQHALNANIETNRLRYWSANEAHHHAD
ncbi:DUF2868 domain-containing protein [Marinomonas mediterranea]|jgi:Protein of unknown function (DUF2868).|uniref:DUF2868 domain-containing protein n=1 Tax=Marinomonas mediterranea (strain ATCC 700492 / JCM 21426 / NBRC 103028 / MMB-1) TaxID=717774 RepID=F2JZK5_MARM1|nr:DUF2868 domain-containing protein [Marinomonas mediterranea]ADZ89788.1 hypothetical protein Marme_0492 [Marinomonas mediterranea MMB-1]WCN11972.1 DUF2868 domain-containing protein [Marinomonas mediterranea]WCN16010.1 DUF2868 domain-containing protein [Marinomonas mediterranea MMB-1]